MWPIPSKFLSKQRIILFIQIWYNVDIPTDGTVVTGEEDEAHLYGSGVSSLIEEIDSSGAGGQPSAVTETESNHSTGDISPVIGAVSGDSDFMARDPSPLIPVTTEAHARSSVNLMFGSGGANTTPNARFKQPKRDHLSSVEALCLDKQADQLSIARCKIDFWRKHGELASIEHHKQVALVYNAECNAYHIGGLEDFVECLMAGKYLVPVDTSLKSSVHRIDMHAIFAKAASVLNAKSVVVLPSPHKDAPAAAFFLPGIGDDTAKSLTEKQKMELRSLVPVWGLTPEKFLPTSVKKQWSSPFRHQFLISVPDRTCFINLWTSSWEDMF